MIEQSHSDHVPYWGTHCNSGLCPTGVLGIAELERHEGGVLENQIKRYRTVRGMTQHALGDAIGSSRNMVAKLEAGSRDLTSEWLEKIGAALDIEPYLLIAPMNILPSEDELAQMLDHAQRSLPTGLPYSEWPKAIAQGLHMRLRMLAGDRANSRIDR